MNLNFRQRFAIINIFIIFSFFFSFSITGFTYAETKAAKKIGSRKDVEHKSKSKEKNKLKHNESTKVKKRRYLRKPEPLHAPINKLINYEGNIIENDVVLADLFNKFRELQNGSKEKIVILQIGDSHIQSGTFAHVLRENLQRTFGNAGRGLICPYALTNTNGPKDFKITSSAKWEYDRIINKSTILPIGICGITIRSDDYDASIFLVNNSENTDNNYDKVTIYYEKDMQDEGFVLSDLNGANIGNINSGNSLYTSYNISCDHSPYMMKIQSIRNNKKAFSQIYGLILENNRPGIIYNAIGVNGATYKSYNKDNFIRQVISSKPDLIIFSLGTNESFSKKFEIVEFIYNVNYLISAFKDELPSVSIIITIPPDSMKGRMRNHNISAIENGIISYCKNNGLSFWNLLSIMGGSGSILKWKSNNLAAKDNIHYSVAGYELQGRLFFDALMKNYNKYSINFSKSEN